MSPQTMKAEGSVAVAGQKPESKAAAKQRRRFCNVCGKPSGSFICGACSDRIRAEALDRKRREDKGQE